MFKLNTMKKLALFLVAVLVFVGAIVLAPKSSAASLYCPTAGNSQSDESGDPDGGDEGDEPEVEGCDGVASTIKHHLLAAGYDENAVAGIMGNLSAESCGYRYKVYCSCSNADAEDGFRAYSLSGSNYVLNSRMTTNCGFGLVQWTPDRNQRVDRLLRLQKYADGLGKSITDLEVQLQFIVKELTTTEINAYYYNVLRPEKLNGRSIEDTTWRVEKWYESPGSVSGSPGYGQVNQVCANASASWCKSFKERLERAKEAKNVNGNCTPASSEESSSPTQPSTTTDPSSESTPSETPEPVSPIDPTPTVEPTVISTTGALGIQNSNNVISQTDSRVEKTPWLSRANNKNIGIYDDGKCCGSGCSLIAVANAFGALHNYSAAQVAKYANDLASWTKSRIGSPGETNTVTMIKHTGMSSKKIWSSKSTSVDNKIAAIRSALASGGMIVAAGDRSETSGDSNYCTSARKASGACVFTPGGHYIAIIGITADNKLVVANPGKSNNRSWVFPPDDILKHSNIGYMVK